MNIQMTGCRSKKLYNDAACSGFAAAALTDQPQCLPAPDVKTDAIHSFDGADLPLYENAPRDRKMLLEILHFDQNVVLSLCVIVFSGHGGGFPCFWFTSTHHRLPNS